MPGGMQQMQGFQVAQEQATATVAVPNYSSPQPASIPQPSSVGPVAQTVSLQPKAPGSVPPAPYAAGHGQGTFLLF